MAKRALEIINYFAKKKSYSGQYGHFGPKVLITLYLLSGFLKFCTEKEASKGYIKIWLLLFLIWGNLIFLGHVLLFDWAQSKLSQVTVTIESLNRQGKVRILKQSGYDFSCKHLCDEYYMDVMWCLCVVVNIQQSVVWFCEKTSLRIFYVILFECKGPLMLKADSVTLNISFCCGEKIWLVKNRRLSTQ